jgi:hypothetical protein
MEDRYQLGSLIGTGGMATVWRARDTLLGRPVAIKRLLPHLASDEDAAGRFRREAQAAASLSHPGIVTVFDTGEDEEGPYIVLELIEGSTLAAKLETEGRLDPPTAASIVGQAAAALDHAHAVGVVHRDVKPSNLIIDEDGRVRLADFGIARTVDDPTTVTGPGELVGTISYLAPEIVEGHPATPASDIYSLGAVTYEMLSGRPPFVADNTAALLEAVRTGEPPGLQGIAPDDMAGVVAAAMSRIPEDRPPTAGSFAASLTARTTLPLQPDTLIGAGPMVPASAAGSEEPTLVMAAAGGRPPPEPAPRPSRWPLAVLGLAALAAAMAAMSYWTGADGAGGTADPTIPVAAGTTTSTMAVTTTASTTTTTILAETVETVVAEIEAILGGLHPPEFKRNDVREVEDQLDKVMEEWEDDGSDDVGDELEKLLKAIQKLPDSEERDRLSELTGRLAELMGVELGGSDDDD